MAFQSYIDPIITLVDRYFEKRRTLQSNNTTGEKQELKGMGWLSDESLPSMPERFVQNGEGDVVRIIHGDISEVEDAAGELTIWQEEFITDANDDFQGIRYTFPDGSIIMEKYNMNANGDVETVDFEVVQ